MSANTKLHLQHLRIAIAVLLLACLFPSTAQAEELGYGLLFDSEYYYNTYPDLAQAIGYDEEALYQHFVSNGMAEGRSGNGSFTAQNYAAANPDLQMVYGENWASYYQHYLTYGIAEGRLTQPVDASYYAPVFDSVYYYNANPDLALAFGYNETALLQHFVNTGMAEGLSGNGSFTAQSYAAAHPDLQKVYGDDWKSYYIYYLNFEVPKLRIVELVNAERNAAGLSSLQISQELWDAAAVRAQEIPNYFSHTRPDGSSCFTAVNNRYDFSRLGENIAAGYKTEEAVVNGWMNSSGHRANILGEFDCIGIGYYNNSDMTWPCWVQLFGKKW